MLWNFFFGGNTLVRFGVIVLFFGVAFLLKYASEHIEISIEARLIGVALGALVMLGIGWRLRESRPGYGLIMQGGGIGVLYITVFAAFRLYQLLPAGLVFVLLAAMAVFSAMLAVLQDSRSLAAMGVSGGFLAPILASTGGGSHVALFSFYALLNLGILLIAWFKAWRSLNLLGFAFTFLHRPYLGRSFLQIRVLRQHGAFPYSVFSISMSLSPYCSRSARRRVSKTPSTARWCSACRWSPSAYRPCWCGRWNTALPTARSR